MFVATRLLFAVFLVFAAVDRSDAATIFVANLDIFQELHVVAPVTSSTGAPRPIPFGTATFVLNDAMTALSMTATIFNIDITGMQTPTDTNDNLGAAHIHASSNLAFMPPQTAGVVWGFFGLPDNDVNPDNLVVTPFSSGVGGTFSSVWDLPEGNAGTNLSLQLPNLFAGRAYINFHTAQYPAGEIRGAITAVPEPSTMLLVGAGLGTVARSRRRKKA